MKEQVIKAKGHEFVPLFFDLEIDHKVYKLAKELEKAYPDGFVLCPVLSGAFMFAADLVRDIKVPVELNFVKYKSYKGTTSTGQVTAELPFDASRIKDKDVVIVEDIVDTGLAGNELRKIALELGARSVKVCTLLFRPKAFKFEHPTPTNGCWPEYVGYELPDSIGFVIGYGMDFDEQFRELPEIWCEK